MLSIKLKEKLYKQAYITGTTLAFFAGFLAWGFRPVVFYPQEKGVLIDVFDTISHQLIYSPKAQSKHKNVPVYLFSINDNVYRIEHSKKENKIRFFEDFKNKEIYFRYKIVRFIFYLSPEHEYFVYNKEAGKFIKYYKHEKRKIIQEIICNGKVIYKDEQLSIFFILLVIFIINLIWSLWAFVIYWKKPIKKKVLKEDEEEYFLENCKIMKSENKYLLYYVSLMDGRSIKVMQITEGEFLSAKNGKMKLEDFNSIYNLW
jgi:hypothetical protein